MTDSDKNSLWWLSHISGDVYSLRPLHKMNMALDVCDDNYSVQLYTAGITTGSPLYSSRWIISMADTVEPSNEYILTNYYDTSKKLCYVPRGDVFVGSTGINHWIFERLSDVTVDSLEGIMIYGDCAVGVGSTTQLTAGVFSTNSMSQSVTFSVPSGYLGITVTSGGVVTGTSTGLTRVNAVSNVDSTITGNAHIAVTSDGRNTATLIGIPSALGGNHDHSSYLTTTAAYLRNIYGTSASITQKQSISNEDVAFADMISSKVFIFRGHGMQNSIWFGDSNLYSPVLFSSKVKSGTSPEFSKSELILYMCCLTGAGGKNADNLVRATYLNGAENTIGFNVEIDCTEANTWINSFMGYLSSISTSSGKITAANINDALSEIDYSVFNQMLASNVVYIINDNFDVQ